MNYLKHFPIAVIVALSACGGGGGGGGSFSSLLTPVQQENVTTASFARLAASNSQTANVSISSALGNLSNLINGNSVLASNTAVNTSALAAQTAVTLAVTAQNNAAAAAADLSIASNVTIAGVVSNGRSICSAASSCTAAEISTLSYRAAEAAKTAAEASLYAITATNQLKSVIVSLAPSLNVSAATDAIATALTSATSAQTNANQSISNYKTASVNIGIQVPTISLSSGTTGSVAGAPTYSGNTQTIVTTYANGQTSTATNTATGSTVSWGSDNVTRTTTYTYANGGTNTVIDTVPGTVSVTYSGGTQTITTTFGNGSTKGAFLEATGSTVSWGSDNVTRTTTYTYANGRSNSVVETVPGTAGAPTYSGNTQTIVTTFGNGQTSTATNTATGSTVSWGSDNVTRTTTYTYANGGTNAVVATVPATTSTPTLTAATYPSNWTTTGTVLNPSVSALTNSYGNGVVTTVENGTSQLPFNQATLSNLSITDPSAVVRSSTTDYNLTWGTPDKNGPAYASSFSQGSFSFQSPINIWGNVVTGLLLNQGPTYAAPHPDVIDAWKNGWTGKDVNIVIADYLTQDHGVVVTSLVARYAIASTLYGIALDNNLYLNSSNVYNFNGALANLSTTKNIGVINTSFGANYSAGVSDAARAIVDNNIATLRTNWVDILKGSSGYIYKGLNLTDAVITKSAGNNSIVADKESFVKAYADDPAIKSRLLVVGALDFDANGKGVIASYSNTAGSDSNVKNRFVVASGGTPFSYGDIANNGTLLASSDFGSVGTSFAAPRVAGYTAILRQKFPNLDAVKSSSIILDTARYDALACNPNCDASIYGMGQASLSRALAPVGKLR